MEWDCVYQFIFFCSLCESISAHKSPPLMVKCWSVLARQSSVPCPAQQQHQQGETQSEERIWPLQKKNWPFDFVFCLPWAASAFGRDLVHCCTVAWAKRGCGSLLTRMCHNWFKSRSGDTTGWLGGCLLGWLIGGQLFGYLSLHAVLHVWNLKAYLRLERGP